MRIKDCLEMEIEDFKKVLNPPATSAMGIPIVSVPLVADVVKPVIGPVHGKDFLTARDLRQFPEGIRPLVDGGRKVSDAEITVWMVVDPEHRFAL